MKETIAIQRPEPVDKYAEESPVINCAERIPFCQASCCKLEVCLTKQDISENAAIVNRRYPYFVAQDSTDYCVHLENIGMCDIYDKRPAVCRSFDCTTDTRIWLDFERMIINPMILEPDWPKGIIGISLEKRQLLTARLDLAIDGHLMEEPPMSERVEGSATITGQVIKRTEKAVLLHVEAERNNFWIPKSVMEDVYETIPPNKRLDSIDEAAVPGQYAIRIPMWLAIKIGRVDSAEELEDADLSYFSID